ncbi:hypothetical protein [Amycolatopsis sp. WQ 127309]|uniref:hypothetical protein n=1 Tax=Amycolatopsis sp. WQ 127309 TaxID=2932773 RepID=UPI001FF17A8F|nr:hypothetical protein [Amycolatopsis sp. WQ 127309]UOZ08481.1 hypothetical protein MUY22_09480 [Amycolatopsis sp. WQ 127309]
MTATATMVSQVDVVDPRVDPQPDGWAAFRARCLPPVWDYELLRREAWLAKNPPVLAVVREGERVVGALSVMVCRGWRSREFGPLSGGRLRPRWAEVYLPLLSGYPACVFDDGVDERAAVRRFERALRDYVGPGLLGVIYRAMNPELVPALDGRGRAAREIDPAAVLRNTYSTVDEWERGLAPEVRRYLHQDVGTEAAFGRTDVDPHELAVLLNAHRARQDERAWAGGQRSRIGGLRMDTRSPVAPGYLDTLVRRSDVLTRTYRDNAGRLLGFATMIDHPAGCAVHHWAARPSAAGGRKGLYVDCYARCVAHMIAEGRPELTAGRAMLAEKVALGFGTRSLWSIAVPRPVLGR